MKDYRFVVSTDNKEEFDKVKEFISNNCKEVETETNIEHYYFKEMFEDVLLGKDIDYTDSEAEALTDRFLNSDLSWMDVNIEEAIDIFFNEKWNK